MTWIGQLEEAGALWRRDGVAAHPHAELTSGKHSDGVVNCDRINENPKLLNFIVAALQHQLYGRKDDPLKEVDRVVGPAMGAIELAHDMAWRISVNRQAVCLSGVAVKQGDGSIALSRVALRPDERVMLVEDVVTTGGSVLKVADAVREAGGVVLPVMAAIVNRSGETMVGGIEIVSLVDLTINTWEADECPLCAEGSEAIRPKENWEQLTHPEGGES